jgi:hypothetical protein
MPATSRRSLELTLSSRFQCCLPTLGLVCVALFCTGCPALNRWNGPNEDPFFSVPVEEGSSSHTTVSLYESFPDSSESTEIADRPSAPSPRRTSAVR